MRSYALRFQVGVRQTESRQALSKGQKSLILEEKKEGDDKKNRSSGFIMSQDSYNQIKSYTQDNIIQDNLNN